MQHCFRVTRRILLRNLLLIRRFFLRLLHVLRISTQKCTWKGYSNSCNTGSMHKRQSTNSLVDLCSLQILLICSTLHPSSEGSGGPLPLGKGACCTFFWRQSSQVIVAAFWDFLLQLLKVAGFPLCCFFPTGLRMLNVRCNVFLWRISESTSASSWASCTNV